MASAYAAPSHLIRDSPPPSWWAIEGAAMLVIVESIRSRMSATTTTARIARRLGGQTCLVAVSSRRDGSVGSAGGVA